MSIEARKLVIRASAGSGKTFQLTNRYLRRLMAGTPADEILAATFTRKAAGEILERVLSRLAKAASSGSESAKLATEIGVDEFGPTGFHDCLVRFLRELHRLRVGTLDSFFARLATNFTLELGLPPGWRIVDERTNQQLRMQAIAAILHEEQTADVARLTNLLAKGDAGRSVSGLIRSTVNDFYDVFRETDAAAWRQFTELHRLTNEQLEDAIAALEAAELPNHTTIAKARAKDVAAAQAGDWGALIADGIGKKLLDGETKYYGKQLSDGVIAAYRRLLDHVRAVFIQELAHQTLAIWELLERFDVEYQKLKREHRSLRFDDVTHRLREMFAAGAPQALGYRLDGHVGHLLLDEFQDTSPAQWQVLRPFAERVTAAEADSSFFCVGDAKQAIYGWRGGVAEIFDALDEQLPGLESLPLSESHRSSPPVIKTVNRLFQGLANHAGLNPVEAQTVRRWCDEFPVHTTAKQELPGYACVIAAVPGESEDGQPNGDVLPFVAQRVADIVRETPWASVGVLLRRNDEVAQVMNLLRGLHVPASEEGGNPITDSAAVLTILSLLTLADHPGDTIARFHVAGSPLGESLSFENHADDAAAAALAAAVRRSLIDEGYGRTLDHWCHALGPAATRRDRMRMGQLVELAYRFDVEATLRPTDFVRFVEQERFLDPSTDRVRIMTVHAAKGLQFDVVVAPLTEKQLTGQTPAFVAGRAGPAEPVNRVCMYRKAEIQRLLPQEMQQLFAEARSREVRETLCRLYVTVTRAIHALHVIISPSSRRENKLPSSPAGLVRAALTNGIPPEADKIVYEEGVRQWHRSASSAKEARSDADQPAASQSSLRVQLAEMTGGRRRGIARVAPSRHGSRASVRLSDVLREQDTKALNRGTVIHAWLEQVRWLDERIPSEERLRKIAKQFGYAAAETDELLAQFHAMLEGTAIARLFSRASYTQADGLCFASEVAQDLSTGGVDMTVRGEQPIAFRRESELVTGSIDRLVLFAREGSLLAAEVIDFKTDAVTPAREPEWSRRVEGYRPQLHAYAEAVSSIYGLPSDRIATRLAFVQPGIVVNLKDFPPSESAPRTP